MAEWIRFTFDGDIPPTVSKKLLTCANHFVPVCFYEPGSVQRWTVHETFIESWISTNHL